MCLKAIRIDRSRTNQEFDRATVESTRLFVVLSGKKLSRSQVKQPASTRGQAKSGKPDLEKTPITRKTTLQ
jgi:hypothetical protein